MEPTKNTFACAWIFMATAEKKKRLDSPIKPRTEGHRSDTATLRILEHTNQTPIEAVIAMIRERARTPQAIEYRPFPLNNAISVTATLARSATRAIEPARTAFCRLRM